MPDQGSAAFIVGTYDYRLVALSVLIAVIASYAALDLGGRINFAQGRIRLLWLSGGAIAMGLGIWSMHYVGMLAYSLPVAVLYDWPTVLLSLLVSMLASGVALFVTSRNEMGVVRHGVGGLLMGTGIAAMHYIGMEAMRLPAMCQYSTKLVVLSIIEAIVISLVALWLTFRLELDLTLDAATSSATATARAAFGELMARRPPTENDEIIASAVSTFKFMGHWLGCENNG